MNFIGSTDDSAKGVVIGVLDLGNVDAPLDAGLAGKST